MQRQLVPITEIMTYVRFTRAGFSDLFGFIVNGKIGRKILHETYLRKSYGGYTTDIMFDYTKGPHDNLDYEYCRTSVNVLIPEGVFGKEPRAWMKWYVNMWHNSAGKIVDECHYRRRLIIAFTLKAIPFLLYTMTLIFIRLLGYGALGLAGFVKDNLILRCFRPYKWNDFFMHVIDDLDVHDNPLLVSWKHNYEFMGIKKSERIPMFFTLPFNPLLLVIQAILIYPWAENFVQTMLALFTAGLIVAVTIDISLALIAWLKTTDFFRRISETKEDRLQAIKEYFDAKPMVLLGVITFSASMAVYLFFTYSGIISYAIGMIATTIAVGGLFIKYANPFLTWIDNIYGISADQNNYGEIKELLCPDDEDNLRPKYDYIPPKQRTVRLWYLDLKNKVCKPMQS